MLSIPRVTRPVRAAKRRIYEPFMGSGTTLIAAETTDRVCYGTELNPAYVDVAVVRWQNLTGQSAILDGTNQSFADPTTSRR